MTTYTRSSGSRVDDLDFEATLDAAKAGQEWAWQEIYQGLLGPVTGYLSSRGASDPDDLASEVFLQVARDISNFTGTESKFRSWVFVIAHRRLQDERRSRARRPVVSNEPIPEVDDAIDLEDEVMTDLAATRVAEILRTLTEDQRRVITLRLIGDLTLEETAAVMGKRVGAIKALQRRALAALKSSIESGAVSL